MEKRISSAIATSETVHLVKAKPKPVSPKVKTISLATLVSVRTEHSETIHSIKNMAAGTRPIYLVNYKYIC